jgi:hypothetical protein
MSWSDLIQVLRVSSGIVIRGLYLRSAEEAYNGFAEALLGGSSGDFNLWNPKVKNGSSHVALKDHALLAGTMDLDRNFLLHSRDDQSYV